MAMTRLGVTVVGHNGDSGHASLRLARLWQRVELERIGYTTFFMPPAMLIRGTSSIFLGHTELPGLRWTQRAFSADASGNHGRVISRTLFDSDLSGDTLGAFVSDMAGRSEILLTDAGEVFDRITNEVLLRDTECGGDVQAQSHQEYIKDNEKSFSAGRWMFANPRVMLNNHRFRLSVTNDCILIRASGSSMTLRYDDDRCEVCEVPIGAKPVSKKAGYRFKAGDSIVMASDLQHDTELRRALLVDLDARRFVHMPDGTRRIRSTFATLPSYCPHCLKNLGFGEDLTCDVCKFRDVPVVGVRGTKSALVRMAKMEQLATEDDLSCWLLPVSESEVVAQRLRSTLPRESVQEEVEVESEVLV